MDEEPKSIWNKPWKGKSRQFLWLLILACAIFVAALALASGANSNREMLAIALISAIGIPMVGLLLVFFFRWLCCWRNLRRTLFVVTCLVTLIALFYAEENWRGKRAWEKYKHAWEVKGEKFDLVSLTPKPVPDDQNLALTPLLKPSLDFTRGTNGVRWNDTNGWKRLMDLRADLRPSRSKGELVLGNLEKGTLTDLEACRNFYQANTNYPQPAKSGTAAEDILVALGKFDSELKELHEAATTRPRSRFPIEYDYEPPAGILLPHLSAMKALSTICELRAIARLDTGQAKEAFGDLQLGFRLSDSIREEPILIDHFVRLAMLGMDLQVMREGFARHAWSGEQLAQLEEQLTSVNLLAELNLALRGERTLGFGNVNWARQQRFKSNAVLYDFSENNGTSFRSSMPVWIMPDGWFYQNMLTMARLHQNYTLAMVDEKAHRVLPDIDEHEVNAVLNTPPTPFTIFAKLLFPNLAKAAMKSARMQTYVDATRVACALERFRLAKRDLPDTLETLLPHFIDKIPNDVIDGKPLRYRKTADGSYVIYSVGWNKFDDGGVAATSNGASVEWDRKRGPFDMEKGDWVWRYPAK